MATVTLELCSWNCDSALYKILKKKRIEKNIQLKLIIKKIILFQYGVVQPIFMVWQWRKRDNRK